MDTIEVEQAVFASSDRGTMKGYQLVARSAGVDRETSQALCRWSPTQFPQDAAEPWTINAYPIHGDLVAVSRTVVGGPEYSGRGASQVVTLILLLNKNQFLLYDLDAMAVARTAMALGHLRLRFNLEERELKRVVLPSRRIFDPARFDQPSDDVPRERLIDTVSELLVQSRSVAVAGATRPIDLVQQLVPRLPDSLRFMFSFTTGLAPSVRRPFQAHFLNDVDLNMRRTLESQNIELVKFQRHASTRLGCG